MLDWLPQEVQDRYGVVCESVFNGPFLELAAQNVFGIVARLGILSVRL
jgi:hypothetical protein